MDRRTLLLGDWNAVVRDGIDVLRLVILGGALVFALTGHGGVAVLLGFLGAITVAARLVNLPRVYDLSRFGWGSVRRISGVNAYEDVSA
jgi:hypothetical protein